MEEGFAGSYGELDSRVNEIVDHVNANTTNIDKIIDWYNEFASWRDNVLKPGLRYVSLEIFDEEDLLIALPVRCVMSPASTGCPGFDGRNGTELLRGKWPTQYQDSRLSRTWSINFLLRPLHHSHIHR